VELLVMVALLMVGQELLMVVVVELALLIMVVE
jgi:hypothetical protein